MENKEQTTQNTPQTPAKPSGEGKKKQNKKNKIRAIISNIIVFILIGFGLFWLIREYFHIGNKTYTEAAQVEEFIPRTRKNSIMLHMCGSVIKCTYIVVILVSV